MWRLKISARNSRSKKWLTNLTSWLTKKRNLIFEGVPEGKREATDRVICDLFDRLDLDKGIYFDACYRVGPYSEGRPRPILVSFERQADRDMVYARRMDLKNMDGLQKVWINEDVSPASKRKREMIRLIDRLWGCGATLSSNVLRRHEWVGLNKHGEILMLLRDELRSKVQG